MVPGETEPASPMASHDSPTDRGRRADKIIRNPANYKVCLGCESIVAADSATCANCHAYRFDDDPAHVVEQARLLATRERHTVLAEDFE